MELVNFVILHYGDIQVTDRCVQSILAMEQRERIKIVIVDNDITKSEGMRTLLKQRYENFPNIHVIQNQENGGFSYANNLGYKYAREEQSNSFILVLNNDIEFTQKDFIKRLDNAYQAHKCHVLGPDIIRVGVNEHQNPMDSRIRTKEETEYTIRMNSLALRWYSILYPVLYLQNRYAERKRLTKKRAEKEYYNEVKSDIVPFGACLIFTPRFVQLEKKAFEPETKFYYEEYILALRCQRKGYQIVYDPSICMLHESGKATNQRSNNMRMRLRTLMEKTCEACKVYKEFYEENTTRADEK